MTDTKKITSLSRAFSNLWKQNPEMSFAQLFIKLGISRLPYHRLHLLDDSSLFYAIEHASKEELLRERKKELNKKFRFTASNVSAIIGFNQCLERIENSAYNRARKLEEYALSEMSNKYLTAADYEIKFQISFYAEPKYLISGQMRGKKDITPFYLDTLGMPYVNKSSENEDQLKFHEKRRKANYNSFQNSKHPLRHYRHCYLFHHIYDKSLLAWQDMIIIKEISIDVTLSVRNYTGINIDSGSNSLLKWEKPDSEIIHNDLPLKNK